MKNIQSEITRIENLSNSERLNKKTILRQLDKTHQKMLTAPGSLVIDSEPSMQLRCALEGFRQEFNQVRDHILPTCSEPQKWLLRYILQQWNVVAYWHFYSDAERHSFYPFNQPQIRKWCIEKENDLFLKKEVANFSLCLLISSAACTGISGYNRYGQLLTEQLQSQVSRVLMPLDPAAPTPKQMAIQVMQWLQDYEAWLRNGYAAGQPDTHTVSGQMLWDAIPLVERDKKLSYLNFWFIAQRAYWRYLKGGNGIDNIQAGNHKLLKNWRGQLMTWSPPVKGESKTASV